MRRPTSFSILLASASLVLALACQDKVEALPDEPPADDDWIDAIEDEDPAGAAAAAPEAVPVADPGAAGSELAAAAEAGAAEAGAAEAGEAAAAPAEGGEPTAAGEPTAVANAGGSGGAASKGNAPSNGSGGAAAEPDVAAEPAAEGSGEAGAEVAPVEPAPAAEPAPPPEPEKPAPPPPITMADYSGTYTFTGGSAQREKLKQAIEDAAQQVSAIIRGIARKRLTKTQILETPITISVSGSKVTFNLGTTGGSWSAEIDGPTTTMKYNGDKYKVKVRSKDGKMITTFMAPDATKTIVYVLNSDRKRLTVHHRLVADQLKTPISFKFSYSK